MHLYCHRPTGLRNISKSKIKSTCKSVIIVSILIRNCKICQEANNEPLFTSDKKKRTSIAYTGLTNML